MYIIIKAIDEIESLCHYVANESQFTTSQKRQMRVRHYREQLIRQYLQQDSIQFARHEYGKPYIIGQNLAFNHSHSQHISALILSEQYQHIGIDVEQLNRKVRFDAMAKHCFHDDEYKVWLAQGKTAQHWFKIWTVKEAVLKAHGLGIRLNLNELNTAIEYNTQYGQVFHHKIGYFQFYCEPCCVMTTHGLIHFMLAVAWQSEKLNHVPTWHMVYQ